MSKYYENLGIVWSFKHIPNTVEVRVSISRAVVVDHDINTFDINTSTKNISCDENTLLKCLERGITRNTKRPAIRTN